MKHKKPSTEKADAVRKTLVGWRKLAENPRRSKKDFPKLFPEKNLQCYLCDIWHPGCFNTLSTTCPLDTDELRCGCPSFPNEGSPWARWIATRSTCDWTEATYQAMRIVHACEKWLDDRGLAREEPVKKVEDEEIVPGCHLFYSATKASVIKIRLTMDLACDTNLMIGNENNWIRLRDLDRLKAIIEKAIELRDRE